MLWLRMSGPASITVRSGASRSYYIGLDPSMPAIPGYDIDGEIGEGAMASVYLATQRSLERKVALKVMAAALAADPTFRGIALVDLAGWVP